MNNVVESIYDETKDIFGLPQTYKNIEFYPVKINEIEMKKILYRLFFQPKNYIPDKQILKMSYIKFLFFIVQEICNHNDMNFDIEKELIKFLKHITHKEKIVYKIEDYESIDNFNDKFFINIVIDDVIFTEQDFENIREIILQQNGSSIEYVEGYLPDLEKKLEFLNKTTSDLDFKDEMYIFCALTGLSEEQAGEKTIYQFKNRLEREVLLKEYELFKPLEVSGQITSKNKEELFKHYLSHITQKNRYGSILIEKEKFLSDSGLDGANEDGNI